MEAKLIGYDEEPIDVAVAPPPDSIELEKLLQKSSSSQSLSQKSSSSSDTTTARSLLYGYDEEPIDVAVAPPEHDMISICIKILCIFVYISICVNAYM